MIQKLMGDAARVQILNEIIRERTLAEQEKELKLVVDTNQIDSPALHSFLSASKQNVVVVTDYCAMELYKPGVLEGLVSKLDVLKRHPGQIMILKGTLQVCGLRGRAAGLQRRLIDQDQTAGFQQYLADLELAAKGDRFLFEAFRKHCMAANEQIDRILPDANEILRILPDLFASYSTSDLAALASGNTSRCAAAVEAYRSIVEICYMVMKNHPSVRGMPSKQELGNTFIFRVVMATYLLGLFRHSTGASAVLKGENFRNDMIDMYFVAYGTFFDGLLTSDKRAKKLFGALKKLLYDFYVWILSA
nr:hypothetical protein [Pseudomonas sp. Marseille-Q3773]